MPNGVSANSGKIAALRRLFRGIPKIVHGAETIETRENRAIVAEFSPSLANLPQHCVQLAGNHRSHSVLAALRRGRFCAIALI
jgi:hypothetical protein